MIRVKEVVLLEDFLVPEAGIEPARPLRSEGF